MRPPRALWCALLTCIVAVGVSAASATSHAAVPFSPVDLANQRVAVGEDLADVELSASQVSLMAGAPQVIPGCALALSGGALTGDCPFLWAMEIPTPVDLQLQGDDGNVTLSLARGWTSAPRPAALDTTAREILMPPGFAGDSVTYLTYSGATPLAWTAGDVLDGHLQLDDATFRQALALNGRYTVYAEQDGRVLAYQVLPKATTKPPEPVVTPAPALRPTPGSPTVTVATSDPSDPDNRGKWTVTAPADFACPPAKLPHEDMIVVCVDATGDTLRYRMVPEGTRLTKPNRYFYIQVLHFVDRRVEVSLGGQIGTYVPGNRGDLRIRTTGSRGGGIGGGQGVDAPDLTISTQTLAPRQPGYAPLTVKLSDLQGEQIGSPLLVEFWIDETFSGAFRMGVAGVFLGGVDQTYAKTTAPNSKQAEITASGKNPVDVDLVVGYSPYLDPGGRSAAGCESAPFCFSPYFGLGLVSANSSGSAEFFKSVHLGIEWELTPSFSVAVTGNLRRVERLASGYHVGQPIDGDVPTENRYVFGLGVVINLSPSFLKIGAAGSAALLQ
ncbi:MAG: hypothetical protein EP329_08575 [Deltaproteobacteria bacterium]|nr:MAG: hypothetical protein EP329_08575 [Deltaproteobacteria bacterium]